METDVSVALVSEYDDEGVLTAQAGGFGPGDVGQSPFEVLQPYGDISRPLDSDENDGASAFVMREASDRTSVMLLSDVRMLDLAPQSSKGSKGFVNARGAYVVADYDTETLTAYVPMDEATKAHLISVGKDTNGVPVVELVHADGQSLSMLDGHATLSGPGGGAYVSVGSDSVVINGDVRLVGGLALGGPEAQSLLVASLTQAVLTSVAASLSASPGTPVTNGSLASVLSGVAAALSGASTTLLKGI